MEGNRHHRGWRNELASRFLIDTEVSMARSKFRRVLRFESLESREVLSSGGPTAQQQYMLQLINEARTDPAAAADRVTTNITPIVSATIQHYGVNLAATEQSIASTAPQPPLAWNNQLAQAASAHSQDMANNGYQSHTGSDGSSPQQRIQQAGYSNPTTSGENAFAYANSVDEAMQAFLIDWGVQNNGHRNNLLQPGVSPQNAYQQVGIGLATTSSNASVGPLVVTQDFASTAGAPAQVVGVAYNDNNGDNFYEPGEGQGNVQIDAVNRQTGQVSSTQTWDSGGYELALAPGQYRLIASVNGAVVNTADISVGNVNLEQDFLFNNSSQGGSRDAAVAAAQPTVTSPPAPQSAPRQPVSVSVPPVSWSWSSWSASVS
jgi:uncharacterized protein YkwD